MVLKLNAASQSLRKVVKAHMSRVLALLAWRICISNKVHWWCWCCWDHTGFKPLLRYNLHLAKFTHLKIQFNVVWPSPKLFRIFPSPKDPLVPICSTHLQPQVFTNLLFVSRHSPAWTYHINGIIKYVAFLSGFFTYNAFEIHSCCEYHYFFYC